MDGSKEQRENSGRDLEAKELEQDLELEIELKLVLVLVLVLDMIQLLVPVLFLDLVF